MKNAAVLLTALLLLVPAVARAEIYTDTLSYPSGLDGQGDWAAPTSSITYTVYENEIPGPNTWHYKYELNVATSPGLSHLIIEVSDGWTEEHDLLNLSVTGGTITDVEVDDFGTQGTSNPGIPEEMHGVKFEVTAGTSLIIEFDSPRVPVWGDSHAKGGQLGLWNKGFTSPDVDPTMPAPPQPTSAGHHLLVPDTKIPEPATMVTLGLGTVLMGVLRRRRKLVS
jgi:hypothetical protein